MSDDSLIEEETSHLQEYENDVPDKVDLAMLEINTPKTPQVIDLTNLIRTLHNTVKQLSSENASLKKQLASIEVEQEHKYRLAAIDQSVKNVLGGDVATNLDIPEEYLHSILQNVDASESYSMQEDDESLEEDNVNVKPDIFSNDSEINERLLIRARYIYEHSSSHKNFCKNLLQELYVGNSDALLGKNTQGRKGKEALPKEDVNIIKTLVWKFYPTIMNASTRNNLTEWRKCINSMDEFLRRPYRKRQPKGRKQNIPSMV